MKGDLTPVERVGSSIKNLGYATIGVFIATIFISFIFAASVASIVTRSGSIEDLLNEFKGSLQLFLFSVLVISSVITFFYYQIYKSLKLVTKNETLKTPNVDRASQLFAALLVVQLVSIIVGYIIINSFMQSLDELASSNPSVDDLERFANDIDNKPEITISNILGIIVNLALLAAFNAIKDWTGELHEVTVLNRFLDANKKMTNVTTGIILTIGGQVIGLTPIPGIGELIGLVGSIMFIVGLIQVGNRFDISYDRFDPRWNGSYRTQATDPGIPGQPVSSPRSTGDGSYCSACGHLNPAESSFCTGCGVKLG